jgi:hypothetical protein
MSFLFNVFSFNRQSNTDGNTAASPYYQWLAYLRPAAEETGISILNLSVQGHESSAVLRAMQTIGTRLWLLASQLEQLPTRQDPGIEKQAKELMLQLHRIFKVGFRQHLAVIRFTVLNFCSSISICRGLRPLIY